MTSKSKRKNIKSSLQYQKRKLRRSQTFKKKRGYRQMRGGAIDNYQNTRTSHVVHSQNLLLNSTRNNPLINQSILAGRNSSVTPTMLRVSPTVKVSPTLNFNPITKFLGSFNKMTQNSKYL